MLMQTKQAHFIVIILFHVVCCFSTTWFHCILNISLFGS